MEFINPILEIFIRLWDCIAKDMNTIRRLEPNLKALANALDELNNIHEDIKRKVELEEERQMVRRKQVESWLQKVELTDRAVKDILSRANQSPYRTCCFGKCHKNCWSSYKFGEEVKKKLKAVDELKSQGNFNVVADMLPRGPVDQRPMEETVGLNSCFQQVLRWVEDTQVKVIGIHGMGGVGKTTLLKKINNKFAKSDYGFNLIIWIVVSKQSNVEKVQEAVCEKLKLPEREWRNKSEDEKAVQIFKVLCTKKFVLLLDDIWRRVDLVKVGVPAPDDQMMSKVVFTTRFEDVCGYMEADKKIKVECLKKEEALALFRKKVGINTLNAHPSIQKLAEVVAEECKGLPLSLITVGRAMAGKNEARDWDRALSKLRKDPSRIMGMGDDVFHVLKFSYDNLHDDIMKSCFIYCCMYPEDYEILIDDILNLWIGEGFFNGYDDIHEARDQGREIIAALKSASLLENGKSEEYVKMHDVIRDMAMWISSGFKEKTNKFLVLNRERLDIFSSTMEIEKVSLWGSSIGSITETSLFQNVSTFVARNTAVRIFPSGFLHVMPLLKVLDLSFNFQLAELPRGIENLVKLEFLNLSNTRIRELPSELKNLKRMKYLLLNAMYRMEVIRREVISSFSLLRVFRISGNSASDSISSLLDELEVLPYINDISITLLDADSVQKLNSSQKLQKCLTSVCFERCDGTAVLVLSSSSVDRMRHLERLDIYYSQLQQLTICHDISPGGYFHSLSKVYIAYCDNLLDVTWLTYAPMLEDLDVAHCASMAEIVRADPSLDAPDSSLLFSRVKKIRLINLPRLCSVCPHSLPFPSLVEICVVSCYSLRRLPFDSRSVYSSLKEIRGATWWWDGLQWEDETLEPLFRSYYVSEGPIF